MTRSGYTSELRDLVFEDDAGHTARVAEARVAEARVAEARVADVRIIRNWGG